MKKYAYALLAVSLVAASSAAIAMRSSEVETIYYNTHGDIVGGKVLPCSGPPTQWGSTTMIYKKYSTSCQ